MHFGRHRWRSSVNCWRVSVRMGIYVVNLKLCWWPWAGSGFNVSESWCSQDEPLARSSELLSVNPQRHAAELVWVFFSLLDVGMYTSRMYHHRSTMVYYILAKCTMIETKTWWRLGACFGFYLFIFTHLCLIDGYLRECGRIGVPSTLLLL